MRAIQGVGCPVILLAQQSDAPQSYAVPVMAVIHQLAKHGHRVGQMQLGPRPEAAAAWLRNEAKTAVDQFVRPDSTTCGPMKWHLIS